MINILFVTPKHPLQSFTGKFLSLFQIKNMKICILSIQKCHFLFPCLLKKSHISSAKREDDVIDGMFFISLAGGVRCLCTTGQPAASRILMTSEHLHSEKVRMREERMKEKGLKNGRPCDFTTTFFNLLSCFCLHNEQNGCVCAL